MSEVIKITEEQGSELRELEYFSGDVESYEINGHSYSYLDLKENVEEHRWNRTDLYVFKRDDGKLFGMLYDVGLTENQENGFIYNIPQLYEVERIEKVVTTVTYGAVQ